MFILKTLCAACCCFLAAEALLAQTLTIGGDLGQPITLSKGDLEKMPRSTVFWSEHGPSVKYEGVLLYDVLKAAGAPLDKQLSGKALASYVIVDAKDGYQAVFTLADVDPAFTD